MSVSPSLAAAIGPRLRATLAALRARRRTPLEWVYLVLWLVYLAAYPIAVIGVACDVRPGFTMAWAGSFLLFIQGGIAALWLMLTRGARLGGLLAGIVALGGLLGETVGVNTGWPFGHYVYAAILGPRLPGSVPLPVVGAWLLVIASAVAWADRLIPPQTPLGFWARFGRQVGIAVAAGVALDLVLEPVAVSVQHYWTWLTTGPYYGIPATNFVGWAALCALLAGIVLLPWRMIIPGQTAPKLTEPLQGKVQPYPIPDVPASARWLYGLTIGMFAIIDLTHGLWLAAAYGAIAVLWLALLARATYHADTGE